jgi:hypothetical protein
MTNMRKVEDTGVVVLWVLRPRLELRRSRRLWTAQSRSRGVVGAYVSPVFSSMHGIKGRVPT